MKSREDEKTEAAAKSDMYRATALQIETPFVMEVESE